MNTLNSVIKSFKTAQKEFEKDSIPYNYYGIIIKYLKIENVNQDIVNKCGKPIYHYFKYQLPMKGQDYFLFLYNTYNPVRFAVETFSSIAELNL